MVMQVAIGRCKHCGILHGDYLVHEYHCSKRPPVVRFWNKVFEFFNKPPYRDMSNYG